MFPGLGEEEQYLLLPAHPTQEKETDKLPLAPGGKVREGKEKG